MERRRRRWEVWRGEHVTCLQINTTTRTPSLTLCVSRPLSLSPSLPPSPSPAGVRPESGGGSTDLSAPAAVSKDKAKTTQLLSAPPPSPLFYSPLPPTAGGDRFTSSLCHNHGDVGISAWREKSREEFFFNFLLFFLTNSSARCGDGFQLLAAARRAAGTRGPGRRDFISARGSSATIKETLFGQRLRPHSEERARHAGRNRAQVQDEWFG